MKTFEDIQNLIQDDINKTDQVLIEHLSSDVALINQMSG
jgi:octaprenyl-diphosphate synthase